MSLQASLALRGRNPDVLSCIANLSNDEVFTPPELANRMLDLVGEAWAANNGGANLWANSSVRFLDPCTKSGVFLREITKRLTEGLKDEIPDLQQRVDHILTRQVFGIALTQITALLARRSLYCSKHANGKHSISKGFKTEAGNIWYERMEHEWDGDRCSFCGAGKSSFDRAEGLENHAYALIHTKDIRARLAEMLGDDMQFDVIIGNPPYQLASDGGTRDIPIYHKFVESTLALAPRFVLMVTPSRWFAGGLGLDEFRDRMLKDRRMRMLVDYAQMDTVFPGVDFEGGVSYFLWDQGHNGMCEVVHHVGDELPAVSKRELGEFDVFVRNPNALTILRKVLARTEPSITKIMATNNEFSLGTNFRDFKAAKSSENNIAIHAVIEGKRVVGWMSQNQLPKDSPMRNKWKVLVPKSYGERGTIPAQILGPTLIAEPPSVSTQTYVFIHAESRAEAESIESYTRTRFFRFLLSLRKITQHAARPVYAWIPQQLWNRKWTDAELYKMYNLTKTEIDFIEKMIRPSRADE